MVSGTFHAINTFTGWNWRLQWARLASVKHHRMTIERNEQANVRVWNIWPNDVCEKGGSIVHSQSCKWQHFIHWNLNFCLLSNDLRNLHLLLCWKSFDLSLPRYIKSSKCKFPCVRLQTFFYEIQTYISLCLFAEYNNRGRGSGLRYTCSTNRTSPTKNAPTRKLLPKSTSIPICVSE